MKIENTIIISILLIGAIIGFIINNAELSWFCVIGIVVMWSWKNF